MKWSMNKTAGPRTTDHGPHKTMLIAFVIFCVLAALAFWPAHAKAQSNAVPAPATTVADPGVQLTPDQVQKLDSSITTLIPLVPSKYQGLVAGAILLLGLASKIGRVIVGYKTSGWWGALKSVFTGSVTAIKLLLCLALPALLLTTSQAQTVIVTDTNGVTTTTTSGVSTNSNWTNTTVKAWSGYQYLGNSGASTATLGASFEIGTFTFGKLGEIGYGAGTEMTIADTGTAVDSVSIRGELTKDLGSTQVGVFAGGGYSLSKSEGFGDVGTIVRYNLYKTTTWFAWIGSGITFRFFGDGSNDYMPTVATGIAF